MIVNSGIADAIKSLPEGIRSKEEAVAETIENNVRQKIIKEHLIDPAFFDEMSKLLNEIIKERKSKAVEYKEYLKKVAQLAKIVVERKKPGTPKEINTQAKTALYNNLEKNKELALKIDEAVRDVKKADFRGNQQKENEIKYAINQILNDENETERIFSIIKQQQEY